MTMGSASRAGEVHMGVCGAGGLKEEHSSNTALQSQQQQQPRSSNVSDIQSLARREYFNLACVLSSLVLVSCSVVDFEIRQNTEEWLYLGLGD